MDPKEYLNRSAGIPLDPSKQKDPEAEGDRVPAEGRAEYLTSFDRQNSGQRTDVDLPWRIEDALKEEQRDIFDRLARKMKRK